ncbi:hypothetical protein HC251_21045 [Iamia sp. SCSIO 61187]|uniref:hypothetical protein n=1 Tax=Iamia sp. SCSIO 61187 TaxID=2722752 RepID=UPI001C633C44|nr:hypothetical protein [Iamia sp. SCSIO 61187]QYG94674.1 hypothetical protein HC251_21045 [Iamia sp. SCSIO 61187]
MPPVDDVLADLAAHPPAQPTPVGVIRGRAARRVRRRRLVTGAAVAVVVLAAGVGVGLAATDDPGAEVVADGGTSTSADPSPPSSGADGGGLEPGSTAAGSDPIAPPPEPEAVVDGDEGGVGDGDTLLITLTGVATGEPVTVSQCRTGGSPEQGDQCSSARGRGLTVQDGPETQLTFTAFHDVFVNLAPPGGYDPGWAPCAPCVLVIRVGDRQEPVARLPMEMDPTDAPIRPQVTLDPPGPLAPGGVATVRASGLQPGAVVGVGWCPTVRLQGGGDDPCTYPDGRGNPAQEGPSTAVPAADDGTLVLADFPLPVAGPGEVGLDCVAEPGACGIGVAADDAASVLALAPLDLTG